MRVALVACLLVLGGCVETRFESPPDLAIEPCDARWKGVWVEPGDSAARGDDELAFVVDEACRFELLERPEKDGPLKPVHVPLNFLHDRGHDYLVVADDQLAGLVKLPPPHGIEPAPAKAFFIARYRISGDRLDIDTVDDRRMARLVVDNTLDGTVDRSRNELHVFIRGDRARILDVLRTQSVFGAKPAAKLERRHASLAAYERERAAARAKAAR